MVLRGVHGGVGVTVGAQELAQVVACACAVSLFGIDGVVVGAVGAGGDDGVVVAPCAAVGHDVGCKTRVAVGIGVVCVVIAEVFGDGITVGHGEGIDEVLRGVHASGAAERRREVFLLAVVVGAHVVAPDDFLAGHARADFFDFVGGVPHVAFVVDACDAAFEVEHFSCLIGGFCPFHAGACRECGACCEQRCLGGDGAGNASAHASAEVAAKRAVVFVDGQSDFAVF